jgi:hypothetical protein
VEGSEHGSSQACQPLDDITLMAEPDNVGAVLQGENLVKDSEARLTASDSDDAADG